MMQVTLSGKPISLYGTLPKEGEKAPQFALVKTDLSETSLADFAGKRVILNIFPSLDTPTCATSVRKFNQVLSELPNTVVLCISKDLPFAMQRFCTTEGLDSVVSLSAFRDHDFEKAYGVLVTDSVLKGLLARAVVFVDESGVVRYTELVGEIAEEPDYEALLKVLQA